MAAETTGSEERRVVTVLFADVADYQVEKPSAASVVSVADDATIAGAVLIRPVGVDEITRTAREGLLMPPKSTFFTPKPRAGLVMRVFDTP